MATIAELIGANPETVQDLLDTARAAEEAKRAESLAEEAARGQKTLEASKAVASEPAEFASRKARALSKQAKAAIGETGEKVISDLPPVSGKMGAAMERAARAAAGTAGEGVIEAAGPVAETPSFMSRIAALAEKAGPSVLEKLGLSSNTISSLGKYVAPAVKTASKIALPAAIAAEIASTPSAGEGSDVVTGNQLTPAEMANTLPGTPVNFYPPAERSELNPVMASSMYDSPQQIIADLSRPKEPTERAIAAPSTPSKSIISKPRTISAGEPTAQQVQKQTEDKTLTDILSAGQKQESQYQDLLNRYKEAQDRQRLAQLGVSLGQAAEKFGSSVAMVKPGDQSFYEQQMKLAGGITDQFKEEEAVKKEAEERDPTSGISKQYQAMAKMMGIKTTGNESAATLKQTMPFLEKYMQAKENREARLQQAQIQREAIAATKEERTDEKANKDFTKMSEKLTSEIASSRSAFGKGANLIRSAEAIETLAKGIDPKDIDSRQITEIARNLDAMLSQGAATISGTKKLIPSSYTGDLAKIAEYITSRPKGAGQQEFVKRMLETVAREKELAKQQIVDTQKKILSGYEHLKTKYPERYGRVLEEHGIPAEGVKAKETSIKDPKVQKYANEHFAGDYDKALAFLQQRKR